MTFLHLDFPWLRDFLLVTDHTTPCISLKRRRTPRGQRGIFPKEHFKRILTLYQRVAQTRSGGCWASERQHRPFCCEARLLNWLGRHDKAQRALSGRFHDDPCGDQPPRRDPDERPPDQSPGVGAEDEPGSRMRCVKSLAPSTGRGLGQPQR